MVPMTTMMAMAPVMIFFAWGGIFGDFGLRFVNAIVDKYKGRHKRDESYRNVSGSISSCAPKKLSDCT